MSSLFAKTPLPSPPRAPDPAALLDWYRRHRRDLPWRAPEGTPPDPYRVWLSEIMLQQTGVKTVIPYFDRFLRLWPDVRALAQASLDEVLQAWQGLGYYARAKNFLATAQRVVAEHAGAFPETREALQSLPGIGRYTAAAIAAIAFEERVAAIDANAARVLSRVFAVKEGAGPRLEALGASLVPEGRAGDFAQALMDLGAALCTPKRPLCGRCPWASHCLARHRGAVLAFPSPTAKPVREERFGVAFWLVRGDGALFLRRREEKGLLPGMIEIPSTPWRREPWTLDEAAREAPFALSGSPVSSSPISGSPISWLPVPGRVRHAFTHFRLELRILTGTTERPQEGLWSPLSELGERALPTLMKKVVRHVLAAPGMEAGKL